MGGENQVHARGKTADRKKPNQRPVVSRPQEKKETSMQPDSPTKTHANAIAAGALVFIFLVFGSLPFWPFFGLSTGNSAPMAAADVPLSGWGLSYHRLFLAVFWVAVLNVPFTAIRLLKQRKGKAEARDAS